MDAQPAESAAAPKQLYPDLIEQAGSRELFRPPWTTLDRG